MRSTGPTSPWAWKYLAVLMLALVPIFSRATTDSEVAQALGLQQIFLVRIKEQVRFNILASFMNEVFRQGGFRAAPGAVPDRELKDALIELDRITDATFISAKGSIALADRLLQTYLASKDRVDLASIPLGDQQRRQWLQKAGAEIRATYASLIYSEVLVKLAPDKIEAATRKDPYPMDMSVGVGQAFVGQRQWTRLFAGTPRLLLLVPDAASITSAKDLSVENEQFAAQRGYQGFSSRLEFSINHLVMNMTLEDLEISAAVANDTRAQAKTAGQRFYEKVRSPR